MCSFVLSVSCFSQGEAKKWYFSNNIGLDFSSSPPTVLINGAMTTSAGCSSIADAAGNLLFYTDGVTVWNQQHLVMANGTGLLGTSGAQNCIIVKQPASTSLYYIFTVQGNGGAAGLNYSVVDITLAAGNGSVTIKNSPLFSYPCEEKITATKHCNQTDAWIMIHEMGNGQFRAYNLTAAGVATAAVTSSVGAVHTGPSFKGQMKFSPNGQRLASLSTTSGSASTLYVSSAVFEFYNFDNSTGLLSTYYSYSPIVSGFTCSQNNCWAYGTEFSPDGTKFYYNYHAGLIQFDLCSYPTVSDGEIVPVDSPPTFTPQLAAMQLGIDGKIYVANIGANSLGVINNPNDAGNNCNYQTAGVSLGTYSCQFGLPAFFTSYFERPPVSIISTTVNCLTLSFTSSTMCAVTGYTVSSYNWSFGDPASGSANTSTLASPTHTYSAGGTYSVNLIRSFICGRNDTIQKIVTVSNPPALSVSSATTACGQGSASVTTSGSGPYAYAWMPGSQAGSVISVFNPGTYSVTVHDLLTGCTATASTPIALLGAMQNTLFTNPVCNTASSGNATVITVGGLGQL